MQMRIRAPRPLLLAVLVALASPVAGSAQEWNASWGTDTESLQLLLLNERSVLLGERQIVNGEVLSRPWAFDVSLGGGLNFAFPEDEDSDLDFTAVFRAGLSYKVRMGLLERVGAMGHIDLEPGNVGPLARFVLHENEIANFLIGPVWSEEFDGARLYMSGGISVALLQDIF